MPRPILILPNDSAVGASRSLDPTLAGASQALRDGSSPESCRPTHPTDLTGIAARWYIFCKAHNAELPIAAMHG